jgi:cytochrome c553
MGVREMRKSILTWLCGAAGVLVAGMSFAAEGSAANGQAIFTNGKGAAAACMTCHGDKAQGNDVMGAPRLAGQGIPYIVKQLTDFAGDKRTPSGVGAVMPAFAKELSEQDRRDVAAYVNSLKDMELSDLKALKDGGQAVGQSYLGQVLVKFGVKDKVPSCQSCHGYNGRGAAPIFPMIGQQKYVYLVNQLHNWRDGSRANDPAGMMRAVAKNLSDDDIINAAAFLSSAPETTMGNHRVPTQD